MTNSLRILDVVYMSFTIYWMSFHQNLSIRLTVLVSYRFPSYRRLLYRFRQYLLRETKIRFIVSARCKNTSLGLHPPLSWGFC